ncbi:MAG: squalene/phytoene synthase family protein [Hyphomicrobium sp.]
MIKSATAAEMDQVRRAARAGEADRYTAALLAPRAVRDALITLAAAASDVARIGMTVHEPHLAEIRIQWWRDAIKDGTAGVRSGHPIADAFSAHAAQYGLTGDVIDDWLDAHAHALHADTPADEVAFMGYHEIAEGRLFEMAAVMLGAVRDGATRAVCEDAGAAYGLARLGMALPYHLANGRAPLPAPLIDAIAGHTPDRAAWREVKRCIARLSRMRLARIKDRTERLPKPIARALLPLALVEPYLRGLETEDFDPAHDLLDVAPLTRVLRIGWAAAAGR